MVARRQSYRHAPTDWRGFWDQSRAQKGCRALGLASQPGLELRQWHKATLEGAMSFGSGRSSSWCRWSQTTLTDEQQKKDSGELFSGDYLFPAGLKVGQNQALTWFWSCSQQLSWRTWHQVVGPRRETKWVGRGREKSKQVDIGSPKPSSGISPAGKYRPFGTRVNPRRTWNAAGPDPHTGPDLLLRKSGPWDGGSEGWIRWDFKQKQWDGG